MIAIARLWIRFTAIWLLLANAPAILEGFAALPALEAKYEDLDFRLRRVADELACHERALELRMGLAVRHVAQHRKPKRPLRSVPGDQEAV
jgi:hypothetical protein